MRVLVADSDARVRSALHLLLQQEPGLTLIGESSDLVSLVVQVKEFQPHLVLLDWDLPGRPAAALLLALCTLDVRPKVIVLSARPEAKQAAMAAGAHAFVSKVDSPESLLEACRTLLHERADSQLTTGN
jgi:DNA-binding NarL/FixJ family response regulator